LRRTDRAATGSCKLRNTPNIIYIIFLKKARVNENS
jgi:hypothetical protein